MSDKNAKQQIIDQLRDAENVLVTVNRNPSVDELSAALALTLLINKLNKHATAVFSGDIPPAITFLDPEKTFENTVNSLRDFIIALDKEKADHLRYKVDGDMVKIFITPYRTTISESDLDFSQGDYNVEMVIAIGVQSEEDLDRALSDHGRIMHDAVVASISNGDGPSQLGTLNWDDSRASSYSEMLVTLADGLRQDKNLLDEQIATAFLTGIVAATERFSNERTTSQSMTIAAELMAAGANQQLIASQLEEANELPRSTPPLASDEQPAEQSDGSELKLERHDEEPEEKEGEDEAKPILDKQAPDGTMTISHEMEGDLDTVARKTMEEQQAEATAKAEQELATSLATAKQSSTLSVADMQNDLQAAADELDRSIEPPAVDEAILPEPQQVAEVDTDEEADEPMFGGVLNATSEQAAADKRRVEEEDRNKTILSHGGSQYVGNPPMTVAPLNSYADHSESSTRANGAAEDMFGGDVATAQAPAVAPVTQAFGGADAAAEPTPTTPTLADIDRERRGSLAPDAVSTPAMPEPVITNDESDGPAPQPMPALPPLPPMPDFSKLPQIGASPDGLPPLPQTPEEMLASVIEPPAAPPAPLPETNSDPGQFRIPGQ